METLCEFLRLYRRNPRYRAFKGLVTNKTLRFNEI